MNKRIHILGPSGSGTTTLGLNLSKAFDCKHLDADDYFWKKTEIPFSEKEEPKKRVNNIKNDILNQDSWILSGSICGWGDALIPLFTHVIYLWIPWDIRKERITRRQSEKFGDAILPEGEMHKIHEDFIAWASRYDTAGLEQRSRATHRKWIDELPSNILTISIEEEHTKKDLEKLVIELLNVQKS